MIGFFVFCLIVAAFLAEKTNNIIHDIKEKERSINNNRVYYMDHNGSKKLLNNKHSCWDSNGIVVDCVTHQIVRNRYQEIQDKLFNSILERERAPGHTKAVVTEWLTRDCASRVNVIWIETETKEPYFLVRLSIHKKKETITKYYKCNYNEKDAYSITKMSFFKNNIYNNFIFSEEDKPSLFSDKVDWEKKIELSKEEFNRWNLNCYY